MARRCTYWRADPNLLVSGRRERPFQSLVPSLSTSRANKNRSPKHNNSQSTLTPCCSHLRISTNSPRKSQKRKNEEHATLLSWIHFNKFSTCLQQLTISFFLTALKALPTIASWLSWIKPVSFCALYCLNLFFTLLKTSSIGFHSGMYEALYIYLKPSSLILCFDFFEIWAERLSMKRQIFAPLFASLSSARYSPNFSILTEKSKTLKCSRPYSFEIPANNARACSSSQEVAS